MLSGASIDLAEFFDAGKGFYYVIRNIWKYSVILTVLCMCLAHVMLCVSNNVLCDINIWYII